MADTYDLGPAVPLDDVRYLDAGTRLLVTGPPDANKREVALEFLAAGQRRTDGVVIVGTDTGAMPLTAAYEGVGGTDDERLRVVDATGFGSDGERVRAVDSPTDLSGIGSAFSRSVEQYVTMDTAGLRVGLLSVTELLDHLDRGSVYKFLRTLMDRIEHAGYLGVCTLDTAACNEQTVGMLADAFDARVQLRESVEGPEFRTNGLPAGGSWTPLSL
ncbi:DUF7504 family protein [Halorarius halobius]|uniref:DUF7504 family protein n=1 Tax=Halorarius halobius TaxID=2962671 RepID=UPI0020CD1AF7|nr:hypothetical protein [Halorarius halobius]